MTKSQAVRKAHKMADEAGRKVFVCYTWPKYSWKFYAEFADEHMISAKSFLDACGVREGSKLPGIECVVFPQGKLNLEESR